MGDFNGEKYDAHSIFFIAEHRACQAFLAPAGQSAVHLSRPVSICAWKWSHIRRPHTSRRPICASITNHFPHYPAGDSE